MRHFKKLKTYISITLLLITISTTTASLNAKEDINKSQDNSYHELSLSLSEYSVLNSAMVSGLNKYGGAIEFHLKMKKETNAIYWIISIQKKEHLKMIKKWIAERSVEIIASVSDFSQLDQTSQIAFNAIKSLTAKIDQALNSPKK